MTRKHVDGLGSEMAHSIIRKFRQRIARFEFLLAPTPGCPRTNSTLGHFVQSYTFDADDLLSKMENQVVMHHGAVPGWLAPRLHFLYRSSPIVYAHRAVGAVDLGARQLRDVIEGRIGDWGDLGCRTQQPIVPLFHNGVVQSAVFRTISAQSFGVARLRSDLRGCDSYEHLAKCGAELPGSLVFGLRPEFATSAMLRPISIGGKWPGSAGAPDNYPSLQVWLSLPMDCSVSALARYLGQVAGRMEKDVRVLQKLAGEIPTRTAA